MEPEIPNLHLFEEEFQQFMRGAYARVREEEWERFYAGKTPAVKPCPHGRTKLTCGKCYFNGNDDST